MAFIPFPWKEDDQDKTYEVEAAKFERASDNKYHKSSTETA